MGEIYRDSVNQAVTFDIANVNPSSAKVIRGAVELDAGLSNNGAVIPYEITRLDGKFDIEWTYYVDGGSYTRRDTHEVVTPVFKKAELVEWDSDFALLDDAAVNRLEKIIRTVIQETTGQKFYYEYGTLVLRGNGANTIPLPKRLIQAVGLNDYTGDLVDQIVQPSNDGWMIHTVRRDSWVDNFYSSNPINNPWKDVSKFSEIVEYTLTGYFGYQSLPADIALAAKILAEDYGCDESLWRDRYIDNIRAADWRFQFDKRAFTGTGNVKVDQILQKYTLNRMVIL